MKTLIALFALSLISTPTAFAAAQLVCTSEDGSQIQATINDKNELSQIRIQVREGEMKLIPGAYAALLDLEKSTDAEKVKSLVVKNAAQEMILVIASGTLVDSSGTYAVDYCEVSY